MDRQTAIRRVRRYLFSQDWKVYRRGTKGGFDVSASKEGRMLFVEVRTQLDERKRIRYLNRLEVLTVVTKDRIEWVLYGETDFADSITEALNVRKR